jgi:16S rRNA (uracil1498-N3)-methyltransferase
MAEPVAARLYVADDLSPDAVIATTEDQAHYLRNVLRLMPGAVIAVFNGRDGEFAARVDRLDRKGATLAIGDRRRTQPTEPDLWLLFAPIKRQRIDILVEKAAELGVAELRPVVTRHTQVERVNLTRLRAHAIEAAEQTERLSVPIVREPEPLDRALASWPAGRRLAVCAERRAAPPIAGALAGLDGGSHAILIGPEGGFAEAELDLLLKLPFVTPVSLGPRVLRADTAAVAALACWQAILGDWR